MYPFWHVKVRGFLHDCRWLFVWRDVSSCWERLCRANVLGHLRCIAVPDYYSDTELAVVNDALKLCDQSETVGLLRHSSAVATAFAHSQGPLQKNKRMFLPRIALLVCLDIQSVLLVYLGRR